MAKHEIQTLISITGQGEEDVVAMLKKYGGDMDAATNALIDSESHARNIANPPIAGALSTAVICFALQGKPNGGDRLRCPRRRGGGATDAAEEEEEGLEPRERQIPGPAGEKTAREGGGQGRLLVLLVVLLDLLGGLGLERGPAPRGQGVLYNP